MSFALELKTELLQYNLLNHPFYQLWNEGKISIDTLKEYSKQYMFQVANLPTYISATHSITESPEDRKILTENLADEELNGKDHLTLWKDFCKALGLSEEELASANLGNSMQNVIATCKHHARLSSAAGFGVLYAQEHNYANIATSKKEGLENHFNIKETTFFTVHEKADVWHEEQVRKLLDKLPASKQAQAREAAVSVMKSLNTFLDEMLALEKNHAC